MFNSIVQPLVQFLHTHPHSSGLIAFFVVFAEAMAVIGVIIPGTITMTAIGILIGSSVIPAGSTFLWAICGAITGDYLSYLLGIYYKDKLHVVWPFSKYPKLLEHSEKFFAEHGGKSVLLGRFIGPMRAMIPMVAGMFKMPQGKFLVAAIPSASLWAVGYMIPGILIGALSMELPPKVATQFTFGVLLAIVIIWFLVWFIQHFFKTIYLKFDFYIMKIWQCMKKYRFFSWFANFLADPREPDNHLQLTLTFIVIVTLVLFFGLMSSVIAHGYVTILDKPVYHLLCSIRNRSLDDLMVVFTMLGQKEVILCAAAIFFLWLLKKRYWYIAIHWSILIVLSAFVISSLKIFTDNVRPESFIKALSTPSFPSGHVLLSIAVFGFLAVLIARELPKAQRKIPYIIAGIIIFLVTFSRIYLGVHWLTDVVGSILFGISILLFITISYRRRHSVKVPSKQVIRVSVSIFGLVWLVYSLIFFHSALQSFKLSWVPQTINMQSWHDQKFVNPLYRANRLGNPIQVFNVQWLGDLDEIKDYLLMKGWEDQPLKLDFRGIIRKLSHTSADYHLSILPQLFHNEPPVFLATKATKNDDVVIILYLWASDIVVANTRLPLWIGAIEYHRALPTIMNPSKHRISFVNTTNVLSSYLDNEFAWDVITHSVTNQPPEMWELPWDGKTILIYPKT